MTFNKRLKETRKDKDIDQKEMAYILGITQQQYSLYENGDRKLPAEMIPKICLKLQTSADYIFGLPKDLEWPREKGMMTDQKQK